MTTAAIVWTDGSGTTGGPAGIGYVACISDGDYEAWAEGSLPLRDATNQQAELLAAAFALHEIEPVDVVQVVSDSQYLVLGWNEWPHRKRKKNLQHWDRLTAAAARHGSVVCLWTKGHAGTAENERADVLAGDARRRAQDAA